ncbi:MAG: DNA topoisomerase IV subunit A [Victivallales bacterium]|nr:DNA topoisomerase IV subunit A [Victivallales bacterium]
MADDNIKSENPEAEEIIPDAAHTVAGEIIEPEALADGESEAVIETGGNTFLRRLMDFNFIEYASYVIKERAIPDVDDGFKPVQRRILWSLHRMDDGKFHKVANVIGHTMQYHPHGDASIGGALVVLANKEFFIEKQGNFGNILTGDEASAARYIECRLSHLGREVLYNDDITEFVDSYDGRNKEPVVLPVKIPSLLMIGCEGIAVGMSTKILSHNFSELLNAQISCLKGESFEVYPDFLQGGMMDVSEYEEGNGKVTVRAKIDIIGRKLVIRELPASTTTESLIGSIERAAEKGKIKIAGINDFTGENVEIEVTPTRGYDPEKALQALYTYTDCSVSISVNMMVIKENQPTQMTVTEVIKRNTEKLLEYLRRELEIELAKLEDMFHNKTLAQIFIENRIYKRIEECNSNELVFKEIYKGLEPFAHMLKREIIDEDIERLLAIQIRRISLFDINKNRKDIEAILEDIERVQKNLKNLTRYAIKYLQDLLDKYGHLYPRRTIIDQLDQIDRRAAALNNIKVGWDRKNGYIGTNVKSDDQATCNEFDHLFCLERNGNYKIINIPEKLFVGRLYDFRKYDKDTEFGVIYSDRKSGKSYIKRCKIDKFITDREYQLCPEDCRLELFTPRTDAIYNLSLDARIKDKKNREINLLDFPERSARARGILLDSKKLMKITHVRYLTEEELGTFQTSNNDVSFDDETDNDDDGNTEIPETPVDSPKAVKAQEPEKKTEPEVQEEIQDVQPEPEVEESIHPPAPPKRKTVKTKPEVKPAEEEVNNEPEPEPEPEATALSKTENEQTQKPPIAEKKNNNTEDDWGIVQPEFGF